MRTKHQRTVSRKSIFFRHSANTATSASPAKSDNARQSSLAELTALIESSVGSPRLSFAGFARKHRGQCLGGFRLLRFLASRTDSPEDIQQAPVVLDMSLPDRRSRDRSQVL